MLRKVAVARLWLFWLELEGEIGDTDENQGWGWVRFLGDQLWTVLRAEMSETGLKLFIWKQAVVLDLKVWSRWSWAAVL